MINISIVGTSCAKTEENGTSDAIRELHPAEETPLLPVSPLKRELNCASMGKPFAGQSDLTLQALQKITAFSFFKNTSFLPLSFLPYRLRFKICVHVCGVWAFCLVSLFLCIARYSYTLLHGALLIRDFMCFCMCAYIYFLIDKCPVQ